MIEIAKQKELKGFGGWLVLFQIYIFLTVMVALQNIVFSMAIDEVALIKEYVPYYVFLNAAILLISVVCMILFYKKRLSFRPLFVLLSIVSSAFSVLYYFFGTNSDMNYTETMVSFLRVWGAVALVIGAGVLIAFVIALYRSQRVKNTFS